ncbi:MAG: GNAT family N-acetyltransferase [Theionarchaea archaeon]|nr:GNAT family N-acetyltransferase [Theionarchaea archaeon]
MSVKVRGYTHPEDFTRVGDFLIATYSPGRKPANWLQPRWEYMHYTFDLKESDLKKFGIWEDSGDIVGVAHVEDRFGTVYFEIHPDFTFLKSDMLEYAEAHLSAELGHGRRYIKALINDFDSEFEAVATSRGYRQDTNSPEYFSQFTVMNPLPQGTLQDGFHLLSLEDDNDLCKVNRVLYRGFNHPGEVPADLVEFRKRVQLAPNFRKDLNIVVESSGGEFVSYAGMWYEKINKVAYVEPVATDPDYRFLGLGKAAVLEGLRRCAALGATVAFVGSGQTFYESIGFRKVCASYPWIRYF